MSMVLAHIHNVGAQFFLSINLLFLSLTVYVIFGLSSALMEQNVVKIDMRT